MANNIDFSGVIGGSFVYEIEKEGDSREDEKLVLGFSFEDISKVSENEQELFYSCLSQVRNLYHSRLQRLKKLDKSEQGKYSGGIVFELDFDTHKNTTMYSIEELSLESSSNFKQREGITDEDKKEVNNLLARFTDYVKSNLEPPLVIPTTINKIDFSKVTGGRFVFESSNERKDFVFSFEDISKEVSEKEIELFNICEAQARDLYQVPLQELSKLNNDEQKKYYGGITFELDFNNEDEALPYDNLTLYLEDFSLENSNNFKQREGVTASSQKEAKLLLEIFRNYLASQCEFPF